jgi:hypothetical protein
LLPPYDQYISEGLIEIYPRALPRTAELYLFAMVIAKIPQVTLEMHERHGRALPLQGWAPDRRPDADRRETRAA